MPKINLNTNSFKIVIGSILVFFIFMGTHSVWAGEYRYVRQASLTHTLSTGQHTPQWYQRLIDNYHPIGCGPTSWTILYAYWYEFKGKKNLFDTTPNYGASYEGDSNPEQVRVEGELSHYTETTHGQAGRGTWGRTLTGNMCQGIEYAKKRGYRYSRCFKITGTEFNKYDHIKRYLDADKPVILNINHKGRGIFDHYVVIEKARIKQEKVRGRWRDRDVEYYVNFGWGAGNTRWITVRQRGRNTGDVYSSGAAFLIDISATPLTEAANANEAACKNWCRSAEGREKGCRMCSHLAGCGPGYRPIKTWKRAGKNWYACAKRNTRRSDASEKNRLECETWCRQHRADKGCVKCDTRTGCGPGYRPIKSWTGYGNNWYACRKKGQSSREQASDKNHEDCKKWCDAHKPECIYCSKNIGCGSGMKRIKSWTGYGTNWHACGKNQYGRNSEKNMYECMDWCNEHKPPCVECQSKRGCGKGQTAMKTFGGKGENWYACRKASSQANKEACEIWCNDNKPRCAKCSDLPGCGIGYKRIESFKGPGKNWFACEKR